jgi:translation initiation factor 2B subunit (eIF-2B alpha/beta/delta family)
MNKKEAEINRITERIKKVEIQGARNIAIAALKAYSLHPGKKTKLKLIKARPTEPMLANTLSYYEEYGRKKTLSHFKEAQDKINQLAVKLIKNNPTVFTHCHSTNVVNALIYAKKQGRKFRVYNTEPRPLMQGRITAR